jgi:hypothetical protein
MEVSVSLRGPVARASPISRVASPCPAASGTGEFARAGGVFVLNRHRSANSAGFRDVSSEPHEVGMRHNSVRNIDGEVVGGIARALLRHEDEIPRTIVGRSRVCGMRHGNKTDYCSRAKRKLFHHNFSGAFVKVARFLSESHRSDGVHAEPFQTAWTGDTITGSLEASYLSKCSQVQVPFLPLTLT